jgi:hypothetical protein
MWKKRFFWRWYSRYALFSYGMVVLLVLIILIVQTRQGLTDAEVATKSAAYTWWLKYVLGFPLGWFVYGKDINWLRSMPLILLVQVANSIIQFFILIYLFRWFMHRQRSQ